MSYEGWYVFCPLRGSVSLKFQTRRFGFLFDHDDAAATFVDQVRTYHVPPTSDSDKREQFFPRHEKGKSNFDVLGFFTRSLSRRSMRLRSKSHPAGYSTSKTHSQTITIAAPAADSFRHIMHIGFNRLGTFEAKNAKESDPVWKTMLGTLHDSSWSAHNQTEIGTANPGQPLDTVTVACAGL